MNMQVETGHQGPYQLRLTLDAKEVHLLRSALLRAAYIDIDPKDVAQTLAFAEQLLETLKEIKDSKEIEER